MPHLVLIFLHSESADGSNGISGVCPSDPGAPGGCGSSSRLRSQTRRTRRTSRSSRARRRSTLRRAGGRELLGLRAARGESRASGAALSRARGLFHLLPRVRERRRVNGRQVATTPALFPGYAFVSIELQWHAARWCPGVLRLVLDGAQPARVPDKVIAELRERERNGLIELPPPPDFQHGDCVKIKMNSLPASAVSMPVSARMSGSRYCCSS